MIMADRETKTGYVLKRKDDGFFQTFLASALTQELAEERVSQKENPEEWEAIEVQALILISA